jgi:repressor LexA
MLTRKQHELLSYIDSHLKETGVSPSFEEMKEALSLRSKSGIHRLISALEERGFLRRHHHRARALEVMRLPENMANQPLPVKRAAAAKPPGVTAAPAVYGRIAAGQAIEALRDDGAHIEVPMAMLGQGDHFALEVAGDSMIEAGILDGDTVIIRRGEVAETGQIIVALIDNNEVTLKRLRKRGASIALEPANARYETRLLPPDRVKVQGRLVALLRKY